MDQVAQHQRFLDFVAELLNLSVTEQESYHYTRLHPFTADMMGLYRLVLWFIWPWRVTCQPNLATCRCFPIARRIFIWYNRQWWRVAVFACRWSEIFLFSLIFQSKSIIRIMNFPSKQLLMSCDENFPNWIKEKYCKSFEFHLISRVAFEHKRSADTQTVVYCRCLWCLFRNEQPFNEWSFLDWKKSSARMVQ